MIDWLNVLYNFLWILGLAVLLITVSLTHWWAEQQQRSFSQILSTPSARLAIAVGFALIALGLTLATAPWRHKIGWIAVLGLSIWEGVAAWRMGFGQAKQS